MKRSTILMMLGLVGCAPAQPVIYQDMTGQGRGDAQFQMDAANCDALKASVPYVSSGNCQYCASIDLATLLLRQQRVYDDCLTASGWQPEQ